MALVVTLAAVPGLLHLQYDISVVYQLYLHLLATTTVFSVLVAIIFYIKGLFVAKENKNPDGATGHILPDLLGGGEITPTVLGIDVKFFFQRLVSMGIVSILLLLTRVLYISL